MQPAEIPLLTLFRRLPLQEASRSQQRGDLRPLSVGAEVEVEEDVIRRDPSFPRTDHDRRNVGIRAPGFVKLAHCGYGRLEIRHVLPLAVDQYAEVLARPRLLIVP